MKCLIPLFILGLLLAGCGRSDTKIQEQLAGTWVVHFEGSVRCTNVIQLDGGYTATVIGLPQGRSIRLAGTILAKDGGLIETITSDSDPKEVLPLVVRGRIIRLDDRQMITEWNARPVTTTVATKVR